MLLRIACCCLLLATAYAADSSLPIGEPVLGIPTIHSLGVHWVVGGDDDGDASVAVAYRATGAKTWRQAMPLRRVRPGAHLGNGKDVNASAVLVPDGARLYAGSILFLDPATAHEVRLSLADPDGGDAERTVAAATIAEPELPRAARVRHVVPGDGGGSGSERDPFRGIAAAAAAAAPGDRFVLAAGTYAGTFDFSTSGEPDRPIVWSGPATGEAVIDGQGAPRAATAGGCRDVWFHRIAFTKAEFALVAHGSQRIRVTRCRFADVGYGVVAGDQGRGQPQRFFIADNTFVGRMRWLLIGVGDAEGDAQWKREERAVQLSGSGHVVCRNAIRAFKDGIDLFPAAGGTCDNDIYLNAIAECIDDGIELDYGERNNRVWHNRIANVHCGITIQPVFGGPNYVVRNTLYNVVNEVFKIHNAPSGVLFLHNTSVVRGMPFQISVGQPSYDIVFRNNLFIGTGGRAMNYDAPACEDIDLDHDGFGGWSGDVFMKVYDKRYATPDDARAQAPVERHHALVDPATAFASGVVPPLEHKVAYPLDLDLRLKPGTAAIDAGQPLPGINDGFAGKGPDLGACEVGAALPEYGPRPER
ncbi:MAG TPA: right-handed parallel beta-helix repeat-containing protein [Planctomycetota bacterium]|nr:right-handed parallel beta-helix repeat-containing protein [Planctomycetota bacterium]